MAVTVAGVRAESGRLRASGWSYRRIALEFQRRYRLNARVAFRLAHGWTQEEAARRWNARWSLDSSPKTGKAFSYWETWPERGGRAPSTRTLERLAELYLCRPGDLLDGEDFGRFDTGRDDIEDGDRRPQRRQAGPGPGSSNDSDYQYVSCRADRDDYAEIAEHADSTKEPPCDPELTRIAMRRLAVALARDGDTERFRFRHFQHLSCYSWRGGPGPPRGICRQPVRHGSRHPT